MKRVVLAALLAACSSVTGPNTTELHFRLDAQTCQRPMPLVFYVDGAEVGRAELVPGQWSQSFTVNRGASHVIGAKLEDGSQAWGPTTARLDNAVWVSVLYCTVTP